MVTTPTVGGGRCALALAATALASAASSAARLKWPRRSVNVGSSRKASRSTCQTNVR